MSKKDISKNYLNIQGWMVHNLELKGNELLAYALIYGFSQDNETEFTGSVNYICTWLNCSKSTVLRTMNALVKRGLIIKEVELKNNLTFNHYKVNFNKITLNDIGGVKMKRGVSKEVKGGCQNETKGGVKMKPNNTINNNNIKNKDKGSSFFVLIESKRGKSEKIDFDYFKDRFTVKEESMIISQRRLNKNFTVDDFDKILNQFFIDKTMIVFDNQNHFFSSLTLYVKNNSSVVAKNNTPQIEDQFGYA